MFEKMKERAAEREAQRQRAIAAEKARLMTMSEKELMVEMIFQLKMLRSECDDIKDHIRMYGN